MSRGKAVRSKLKQISADAPRGSTSNRALPRQPTRDHLKSSVLEELWSIWRADPRVPSVTSRRSWAISRNANPRLVDGWFLRRRTCAKKAGQQIPDGSYELQHDPPVVPKREQSATPVEPDLPSDDATVYLHDCGDLNDIEASSDTVFDEETFVGPRRTETPAYKEDPSSKHHHSQQKQSTTDFYTEDHCGKNTSSEGARLPTCDGQGQGKWCILCSTESVQDAALFDSGTPLPGDPKWNVIIPGPRLDFSPDTLSELSAIPFLFHTPLVVPADNPINNPSVDNWTVVEDELRRLVNDGKLDFSFLDAPHLASMELPA